MKKKVLFVDDEHGIRETLPLVLRKQGFDVTVASSITEALKFIQNQSFDILLSDLNIGDPGDGFIVVSAMRRIQPRAATFILTGYPDFETALRAIRNQVDDYLVKPADIQELVRSFKEKSVGARAPLRSVPPKRISVIIRENQNEIVKRWLARVTADQELSSVALSKKERIDHLPDFLDEIADRIESGSASATKQFSLS